MHSGLYFGTAIGNRTAEPVYKTIRRLAESACRRAATSGLMSVSELDKAGRFPIAVLVYRSCFYQYRHILVPTFHIQPPKGVS